MTSISKKFLAASIIYFLLGLTAQTVNGFDVWLGFNPLAYTAITITQQLLLIGWLTQAALALIYDRWLTRISSYSGLTVFILFNLGLPLALIGQPGLAILGETWLVAATALGAILQLVAGVMFAWQVWNSMINVNISHF
jgi:hypothetical protein